MAISLLSGLAARSQFKPYFLLIQFMGFGLGKDRCYLTNSTTSQCEKTAQESRPIQINMLSVFKTIDRAVIKYGTAWAYMFYFFIFRTSPFDCMQIFLFAKKNEGVCQTIMNSLNILFSLTSWGWLSLLTNSSQAVPYPPQTETQRRWRRKRRSGACWDPRLTPSWNLAT